MTKTFTCKELGGVCDEKFRGESVMEIIQMGGSHMMSDDAHKTAVMSLEERSGENREQWMARMEAEFAERASDSF